MAFIQPEVQNVNLGWVVVAAIVSFFFGTTLGCWLTFVLIRGIINV